MATAQSLVTKDESESMRTVSLNVGLPRDLP
jgi:hypothetical protein